ncbi:hypothetical protein TH63_03700 [Rufibacter radiotolerans]|uniref:Uncharacterized protein n=1 Tax=Rufibacter radiotolerans TaxID=1379910 RepID=A0A0H4VH11_9BACT|nr:hypothetical protein [Rufibacter radiotolerans]AKQ44930.1 hypothetical protein TH63_03700 [Rufibacter radiotolerans]
MKEKKSKRNALILALIVMSSLLGSMILAINAFKDISKYNEPYLFTAIIIVIGLAIGYSIWKKVKPIILRYSLKKYDDGTMSALVIMTVIGALLFAINELNISLSYKTGCDSFFVVNKYRQESGFRKPEINTLVVNLGNKQETVVTNYNLWLNPKIGDEINLCFYESFLGFNYIELNK